MLPGRGLSGGDERFRAVPLDALQRGVQHGAHQRRCLHDACLFARRGAKGGEGYELAPMRLFAGWRRRHFWERALHQCC